MIFPSSTTRSSKLDFLSKFTKKRSAFEAQAVLFE